ncbi:MAG: cob(I)yrinic acid a,c-diamide adenosyltransferase [Chloroflexota bacterium]
MAGRSDRGLIQIYTGEGKGKTTAALGTAIRATGQGLRVGFIQFLKGEPTGEHLFVSLYQPFDIVQISTGDIFIKSQEQLKEEAQRTLAYAEEQMLGGKYDLLVLDEIFIATHKGFITIRQVLDLLEKKPARLELVLTGRDAPPEIIERADLVTEMRLVKHPFRRGIAARRGIEY